MKVRQAIPVTSELGDTSKLARFDGECLRPVLCNGAAPGFPPLSFGVGAPWRNQDHPHGVVVLWLEADLWGAGDGAGSTGMELAMWRRPV